MGGDGAEGAAAETATMYIHRVPYHLVGRDGAALRILRVWHARIRQVERGINLLLRKSRIGRIDIKHLLPHLLQETSRTLLIRLLLHMPEIRGIQPLVPQTHLV